MSLPTSCPSAASLGFVDNEKHISTLAFFVQPLQIGERKLRYSSSAQDRFDDEICVLFEMARLGKKGKARAESREKRRNTVFCRRFMLFCALPAPLPFPDAEAFRAETGPPKGR